MMTGRVYATAIVVFGLVTIAGLFARVVDGQGRSGTLKLNIGKQSVEWTVEKSEINLKQILDLVFADPPRATESPVLLMEAIERLDYDHPISRKLRDLQGRSKGPFTLRLTPVKISASEGTAIQQGRAAVCHDHEFYGANLILLNREHKNAIRVTATEHLIICSSGGKGVPVELNVADAQVLFDNFSIYADAEGFAFPYETEPILPNRG